ncbi:hypothetical protein JXJ21_18650 [candidate division KSB1 bacterium]|nr:hypothetical protein [candidate division KSB1 bacterium]
MRLISSSIFIILFFTLSLSAKNFETVVEDTIGFADPGQEIALGGIVKNLTSNEIQIEIIRNTNNIPDSWSTSLCLDLCAAPWIDTVTGTLNPNDSLEFSIHFFTCPAPNEGEAQLIIREVRGNDAEADIVLFQASTANNSAIAATEKINRSFRLLGNYPNPFNNSSKICFQSAYPIRTATLRVYSILGRLVAEENLSNLPAGDLQINFSGTDTKGVVLPGGSYIYKLAVMTLNGRSFSDTGRFTFLK